MWPSTLDFDHAGFGKNAEMQVLSVQNLLPEMTTLQIGLTQSHISI